MPFQIATELHNNCDSVRAEQTKKHTDRIGKIDDFIKVVSTNEHRSRLEQTDEQTQAIAAVTRWSESLKNELTSIREEIHHQKMDEVLERIAGLYGASVGPEPTEPELEALVAVAGERFKNKIPPGYGDSGKTNENSSGDYIFWAQTMKYAKENGSDVILVTDDSKEDWRIKTNGKALRPRPELIMEFERETGQRIVILNSDNFFYHVTANDGRAGSEEARMDLVAAVNDSEDSTLSKRKLNDNGRWQVPRGWDKPLTSIDYSSTARGKRFLERMHRDDVQPLSSSVSSGGRARGEQNIIDAYDQMELIVNERLDIEALTNELRAKLKNYKREYAQARAKGNVQEAESIEFAIESISERIDIYVTEDERLLSLFDFLQREVRRDTSD
ncbi:hypothetical protein CIK74_00500 [Glutamicibacter sp. BW77]|nr:hypothetical protein CIK74_00500 [Glutamicibacter sp. BW77]